MGKCGGENRLVAITIIQLRGDLDESDCNEVMVNN